MKVEMEWKVERRWRHWWIDWVVEGATTVARQSGAVSAVAGASVSRARWMLADSPWLEWRGRRSGLDCVRAGRAADGS